MLKNYLRISWRNITRNKTYAFINTLGLTIGISICLVIYLIVHFELSFDQFHPDKDRIYRIITEKIEHGETHDIVGVPPILPLAARDKLQGVETIAGYHIYRAKISLPGNDQPNRKFDNQPTGNAMPSTIITGPEWFSIFNYEWVAGSPETALNRPFQIVLSENKAKKYFGNTPIDKIIGRQIVFNDSLRLTVSGIVKEWKANTDFPFSEFISFPTIRNSFLKNNIHLDDWGNADFHWSSEAFVKLDRNRDAAGTNARLTSLIKDHISFETGTTCTMSLQPLSDIHFNAKVEDGIQKAHLPTLCVLIGIAIFILLLAVVNFINLSTAMSIRRAKEIGIRKVLGSDRISLIFQFLTETTLLTFFALLISILSLMPLLTLFHSFIPSALKADLLSPSVLIFLFSVTLVTALLSGFYPAKVLSSYLPVLCLKGGAMQTGHEKGWIRKGLIVFQFTISLIFIISTIVIGRQIRFMCNEELGFTTDAVLSVETTRSSTDGKAKMLAEEVRHLPGVTIVAQQSFDPTSNFHADIPMQYKDNKGIKDIQAALQVADQNFIPLYQMKLLAGINLRHQDSLKEFVINESLARSLGFTNPREAIGKSLYLGTLALPIIGVVSDFHEYSYHEPIKPVVIADIPQAETSIAIKLATRGKQVGNLKAVLAQIQAKWRSIYPEEPFNYSFLDDSIAAMYETEQKTATLMNTAVILTIFISCLGLFGLSMFTAKQRTKEMGIRKVLGASGADIAFILSKSFVSLIAIAILIASPIAWYFMNRWLQDFAYRITISWWMFLIAGLAALSVALFTISFQTIKMVFVNPVEALRTE